MNEILDPIRERRHHFEQHIEDVYRMLEEGSAAARATAAQTLNDVRNSMRINYFADKDLINEQAIRFRNESNSN